MATISFITPFSTFTAFFTFSHLDINNSSINNFSSTTSLFLYRNRDLSGDNSSLNNRNRYRNWVCNRESSNYWSLQMMNSLGVVRSLDNRLVNDFLSRNINGLNSSLIVYLSSSYNRFLVYSSVSLSLKIDSDIFSLDNWLNVMCVVMLSSRSWNSLNSLSLSVLRFTGLFWIINSSSWFSNKFNIFSIINYFSVINRLGIIFLSRDIDSSNIISCLNLNRSCHSWVINSSSISSINLYSFGSGMNSRLNISFSNSNLSRNIYINTSCGGLIVNNCISCNSLGINWSLNNLFSDHWSLYNSLFDDRLRDDSLCNYLL